MRIIKYLRNDIINDKKEHGAEIGMHERIRETCKSSYLVDDEIIEIFEI